MVDVGEVRRDSANHLGKQVGECEHLFVLLAE